MDTELFANAAVLARTYNIAVRKTNFEPRFFIC